MRDTNAFATGRLTMDTPLTHTAPPRGQGSEISLTAETFADLLLLVDPPDQVLPTADTLKTQPTSTDQPIRRSYLEDLYGLMFPALSADTPMGEIKQEESKQQVFKQQSIQPIEARSGHVDIKHESMEQTDTNSPQNDYFEIKDSKLKCGKHDHQELATREPLSKLLTSVHRILQPNLTMQSMAQLPTKTTTGAGNEYEHLRFIREPFQRSSVSIDDVATFEATENEDSIITTGGMEEKITGTPDIVNLSPDAISPALYNVTLSEATNLSSSQRTNQSKVKDWSAPHAVHVRTPQVSEGTIRKEPTGTTVKTRLRPQASAYYPRGGSHQNIKSPPTPEIPRSLLPTPAGNVTLFVDPTTSGSAPSNGMASFHVTTSQCPTDAAGLSPAVFQTPLMGLRSSLSTISGVVTQTTAPTNSQVADRNLMPSSDLTTSDYLSIEADLSPAVTQASPQTQTPQPSHTITIVPSPDLRLTGSPTGTNEPLQITWMPASTTVPLTSAERLSTADPITVAHASKPPLSSNRNGPLPASQSENFETTYDPPSQRRAEARVSFTPVLATRTTAAVIAELNAARHARDGSTKKRCIAISIEEATLQMKVDEPRSCASSPSPPKQVDIETSTEQEHENLTDDEDDDEDVAHAGRPRTLSERRRIQDAQFNLLYKRRVAELVTKVETNSHFNDTIDDESRSTKWLFAHSDDQPAISHAREYQLELFERAKKENIIAVLDTGMSAAFVSSGRFY